LFSHRLNSVDNNGWTALHFASFFGYLPIVEKLLSHGASKFMPNENGDLPHVLSHDPEIRELFAMDTSSSYTDSEFDTGISYGSIADSQSVDSGDSLDVGCAEGILALSDSSRASETDETNEADEGGSDEAGSYEGGSEGSSAGHTSLLSDGSHCVLPIDVPLKPPTLPTTIAPSEVIEQRVMADATLVELEEEEHEHATTFPSLSILPSPMSLDAFDDITADKAKQLLVWWGFAMFLLVEFWENYRVFLYIGTPLRGLK
jgi:hypothetical protein